MKKRKDTNKYPFDDFPDKFIVYNNEETDEIFEGKTFIGTELGGEGHRLRNYAIISTRFNKPFTKEQKQIIKYIFNKIFQDNDSQVDQIIFGEDYALIELLVSIEVAVGKVLDKSIIECNKETKFLRFHYYLTNVKYPSRKTIKEYLSSINTVR